MNKRTFVVEFINKQGRHPCGSDWTTIIHDLKTIRGVKNRVKSGWIHKDAVKANIYTAFNVYNRDSYKLVSVEEVNNEIYSKLLF
jgi:hypothetical protein